MLLLNTDSLPCALAWHSGLKLLLILASAESSGLMASEAFDYAALTPSDYAFSAVNQTSSTTTGARANSKGESIAILPIPDTIRWQSADIDSTSSSSVAAGIVGSVDFQSPDSPLRFARHFHPDLPGLTNGLGAGWHHTYDVRLTGTPGVLSVHDSDGSHYHFSRVPADKPGETVARSASNGMIETTAIGHLWTRPDGWRYRFVGPYLASIDHIDLPHRLSLHYTDERLVQVTNQQGEYLAFDYADQRLSRVRFPDERILDFRYGPDGVLEGVAGTSRRARSYRYRDEKGVVEARRPISACQPGMTPDIHDTPATVNRPQDPDASPVGEQPEQQPEELCDTEQNPPPAGFNDPPPYPFVNRVDVRPGSCQSYFAQYEGINRGQAIEAGFEQHEQYLSFEATVNSFPIVDFITDDELIIIKSRDLTSPYYNDPANPNALYDTIMRDGLAIEQQLLAPLREEGILEVTENGQTTRLTQDEAGNPVLEIVIQYGMATPEQWEQIRRAAAELEALYGIEVRVVEIP